MKPKISIITLGVSDVEASRKFYEAMGLTPRFSQDDFVLFEMEGTKLALFPRKKLEEDIGGSSVGNAPGPFTLARNEPSKEAVDKTYGEALALGAKAIKKPEDVFWGGYSGYFADPDGHLWEVAWNPMDPELV